MTKTTTFHFIFGTQPAKGENIYVAALRRRWLRAATLATQERKHFAGLLDFASLVFFLAARQRLRFDRLNDRLCPRSAASVRAKALAMTMAEIAGQVPNDKKDKEIFEF